jgi:hypothetical protein
MAQELAAQNETEAQRMKREANRDVRGVTDPDEAAAIIAHHERRLASLSEYHASHPISDCSALIREFER